LVREAVADAALDHIELRQERRGLLKNIDACHDGSPLIVALSTLPIIRTGGSGAMTRVTIRSAP
jgi:hypothetical protein